MAKVYFKTILLTVAFTTLLLVRLNLLFFNLNIPIFLLDFFMVFIVAAILINEKFTKGEHWTVAHVILLLICGATIFYIVGIIHGIFTQSLF